MDCGPWTEHCPIGTADLAGEVIAVIHDYIPCCVYPTSAFAALAGPQTAITDPGQSAFRFEYSADSSI